MAATSGNTHITDGMIFTQETCDSYLAEINTAEERWEWMTGVTKAWVLKKYTHDGSAFTGSTASSETIDGHETYAGSHFFLPHWRTANGSVTEVTADPETHSYDQWNKFTNDRSAWDSEAATLKSDFDIMKATHVEMLATVD
jgi:hypothetical protein